MRRVLKSAKFIVDSFRYKELLQIKLDAEERLCALLQMYNMTEFGTKLQLTLHLVHEDWAFD